MVKLHLLDLYLVEQMLLEGPAWGSPLFFFFFVEVFVVPHSYHAGTGCPSSTGLVF